MKYLRFTLISLLLVTLLGCGHGYEGEFAGQVNIDNPMVNAMAGSAGSIKLTIGGDYIESDGQRRTFDDIFVRDSGGDSYLVFKDKSGEEAWKIIDKNTLLRDHGMVKVQLERVR